MTANWIASVQRPDGAIPWYQGGPLDPWNHIEAAMGLDVAGRHAEAKAAYRWLTNTQNPDGSWYAEYRDTEVANRAKDANFTAYIAVGVLHHALIRDRSFLNLMWPTVRSAIDFVLLLREPSGAIRWRLLADGGKSEQFLLTGCASIYQSLRCAATIATKLGQPRPDWIEAAEDLGSAIRTKPELFIPKPHAMDWYYPVLCSVLEGHSAEERLERDWTTFVVPGLGVRCVDNQPWVTGGETAELALTLALRADNRATTLLANIERLRHTDGSYWTGYQFENEVIWPTERTTWTAGAILLAHAALNDEPATHAVFS